MKCKKTLEKNKFSFLIPSILVIVFLGAILTVSWYNVVWRQGKVRIQKLSSAISNTVSHTGDRLSALSQEEELAVGIKKGIISPQLYESLYSLVNGNELQGHFYILDKEFRCIGGSLRVLPDYLKDNMAFSRLIKNRINEGRDDCMGWETYGLYGEESYVLVSAISDENSKVGYLLVDFSQLDFRKMMGNNQAVVTNSSGYIYWDTGWQISNKYGKLKPEMRNANRLCRFDGRWLQFDKAELNNGDMVLYSINDITSGMSVFISLSISMFILLLTIVIFKNFFSRFIIKNQIHTLNVIADSMRQAKKEGAYVKVKIDCVDEYQSIIDAYNELCEEINLLLENNRKINRLHMTAELKNIETQFSPHFLFNVLETVKVLISIDPQNAQKALTELAGLLRYSIHNSFHMVKLKQDIFHLEQYLDIQKLRFSKKLFVEIKKEPEAEELYVPRLLSQPLVENATKYGKDKNGVCRLLLEYKIESDELLICASDSGIGMTDAEIEWLMDLINQEQNVTEHHGLYGLNSRIRLIYGENYGLEFRRNNRGGMSFQIKLPCRREAEKCTGY